VNGNPTLPTTAQFAGLRKLIDEYLLGDLQAMLEIREPAGLGFPMLQTILGGMELTGKLMGGNFGLFFGELAKDEPRYRPAQNFFWRAVRNTTAHGYLVHTGIDVDKNDHGHLTQTRGGHVRIDLVTLHGDFVRTYTRLMDEVQADRRQAHGFGAVWESLSEQRSEVAKLAAILPPFVAPASVASSTSVSGTGSDSDLQGPSGVPARASGGSVTAVPSSSSDYPDRP